MPRLPNIRENWSSYNNEKSKVSGKLDGLLVSFPEKIKASFARYLEPICLSNSWICLQKRTIDGLRSRAHKFWSSWVIQLLPCYFTMLVMAMHVLKAFPDSLEIRGKNSKEAIAKKHFLKASGTYIGTDYDLFTSPWRKPLTHRV